MTSRGISTDTADEWMLGYVLDPHPGHESRKGFLSIPYLTPQGVVGLNFRCLQDHDCKENGHAKYMAEAGGGTYLFGVNAFLVDSPFICICEGELDTITANQAGLPAVGVGGTSKWMPWWRYCFEGYEQVIVLKDGDIHGDKLGQNAGNAIDNARIAAMPDGMDVNKFFMEHGAAALRKRAGV